MSLGCSLHEQVHTLRTKRNSIQYKILKSNKKQASLVVSEIPATTTISCWDVNGS